MADLYSHESAADKFTSGFITVPGPLFEGTAVSEGRLAATLVSDVWGWKVGEPINNRTIFGSVPKWSTVRRRYWKNKAEWAKSNSHRYGEGDLKRMERGLAPQKVNDKTGRIERNELHHLPPQFQGGLFDVIELWL